MLRRRLQHVHGACAADAAEGGGVEIQIRRAPVRLPTGAERFARLSLVLKDFDSTSREKNYLAELFESNREVEVI